MAYGLVYIIAGHGKGHEIKLHEKFTSLSLNVTICVWVSHEYFAFPQQVCLQRLFENVTRSGSELTVVCGLSEVVVELRWAMLMSDFICDTIISPACVNIVCMRLLTRRSSAEEGLSWGIFSRQ